ncbi:MAG: hypothetical protein LBG44_07100 [Gemmatimonadota bacterium]|jgi:S-DNA-T family DNA segregation ATPase FtsK/SpoIIIE|nr:hypothetical protein [Gemmatimonadota bacterium]
MPGRPKAGNDSILVDEHLQRVVWTLALMLLAILLALSLVPLAILGEFGARLFPTGNIVGSVGRALARWGKSLLGVSAFLVPAFPALGAASLAGWMQRRQVIRAGILLTGLLLFVPTGIFTLVLPVGDLPGSTGWIGRALGAPLAAALGWVGATLVVVFVLAAVFTITLGWDPIRGIMAGGAALSSGSKTAATLFASFRDWLAGPSSETEAEDDDEVDPIPESSARPVRPARGVLLSLDPDDEDEDSPFPPLVSRSSVVEAPPLVETLPPGSFPPRVPVPVRGKKQPVIETLPDSGDPRSSDLPSTELLTDAPPRDEARHRRQLDGMGKVLVEKLATFRIEGEIVGTTTGPAVTQFEVSPAPGVKVARIANLEADLALAMRAASVRIVAPIPGKAAVGVEIPNLEPETVFFREVIESAAFRTSSAALPLALGKDISGKPYIADLARMPHLLIAGATGSGKSVCINTIITSLIYRHSPQTLRLLMVDPKMVELSVYNDVPHLRHPVVTDNNDAAGVLKWALIEMERRYALLSSNNVRNLQDFNKRVSDGHLIRSPVPVGEEGDPDRFIYRDGPLPYIVLIIDELADLMMTVQGDVEKPLAMLAQKARAIGIHLILATQRPSVNVITGLIKANFPSRIAFRVSSKVDSRTILDQNGADTLLGNGDMLFLPPGRSDPLRIQGAYLSTDDTEELMDWYRERAQEKAEKEMRGEADPSREQDILEIVRARENSVDDMEAADDPGDRDKLFQQAASLCIQHGGGSTSLLQRRLEIGYGRAARIIDQLENAGILGGANGSKPREVLIDFIQFSQLFPDD